ncbi:FmdB family zinc ribbon protein [Acidisoma sp. C75]
MPLYDYLCADCGAFTAERPMALFDAAMDCPACGRSAPRALLTVPHLATMEGHRRRAHGVNEQSAHAPATTAATGRHPPGCGCCGRSKGRVADAPAAAKSFPSSRPWMISH